VLYHPFGYKSGGASYPTEIVLLSEQADLAVLEVVPNPGTFLGVTFSDAFPRVGDPVFHVGNFSGPDFDGSVTTGIIAQVGVYPARLESIWPWALTDVSTATNMRGSSGGRIFDPEGRVVGVVVGNKENALFVHQPMRLLRDVACREGFEWLFDPAALMPPDAELKQMEAWNTPAAGDGSDAPQVISLEDFLKLAHPPVKKPAEPMKPINPGSRVK